MVPKNLRFRSMGRIMFAGVRVRDQICGRMSVFSRVKPKYEINIDLGPVGTQSQNLPVRQTEELH
jgi:hypothetical protein